jgi:hypothetical protein
LAVVEQTEVKDRLFRKGRLCFEADLDDLRRASRCSRWKLFAALVVEYNTFDRFRV